MAAIISLDRERSTRDLFQAHQNEAADQGAEFLNYGCNRIFSKTTNGILESRVNPKTEMRGLVRAEKNIGDALEGHSMEILIAAEKRAQRLGVTDIELQIGSEAPASSIIKIAAREAADAIVLGRRGRG